MPKLRSNLSPMLLCIIMTLKRRKVKFELGIKLKHNIYNPLTGDLRLAAVKSDIVISDK